MRIFLLLVLLFLVGACSAKKRSQAVLFNGMMRGYERGVPPSGSSGKALVVKYGIYLRSLKVDSEKQEITLGCTLRQRWNDPRLQFPDDEETKMIGFDGSGAKRMWLPDTFLKEGVEKQSDDREALVHISKDGSVVFAERVMLRISCPMSLNKFPFDTQSCPIQVESFKYKMDEVELQFMDDDPRPLEFDSAFRLDGFKLSNTSLMDCSQSYSTGSYPCLSFNLLLEREYGAQLRHMFVPSVIILIFIYLSTWMGNQILLPRTLVLIASTILLGINMVTSSLLLDHPKVSYLTAGDLWYPIIMIFLMIAILEFALVARLTNHADGSPDSDSKYGKCGNCFEWIFRIVFLVVILLFLAAYFGLYMS